MQLSEVLKLFDSPLSQEQCWSICYGTCKALITKRREDYQRKERIKYILNLNSLILTQRGEIEILFSEPNFQEIQKDSELIFTLGNLLCRCLDHGLSEIEICEVKFQDDLAELIGGMVLQSSEFDEGIGDADSLGESWESRKFYSSQCRSFKTIIEVTRFCEARLLRRNVETRDRHYLSVSKALYIEASELKAFLGHVLHDLEKENNVPIDEIEGQELAKRYVKEWAKLWLRVMDELRQKTKSRRKTLKPEDYQYTPFDIVNMGNNEDLRANMSSNEVVERSHSLPNDAEDRIFNFLRSRVSSQEELKSGPSSPDKKHCSPESEEQCNESEQIGGNTVKKKSTVDVPLVRRISNWEYSLDDTLEEDFLNGSYERDHEAFVRTDSGRKKALPLTIELNDENINDQENNRATSYDLVLPDISFTSASSIKRNSSLNTVSVKYRLSKSEICLHEIDIEDGDNDSTKIGSSLTEIFKIRQEITRSEMDTIKDLDVKNSKKCFGCKKKKFSIFQRSKLCAVCNKKYCLKCMKEDTDIPSHLIDAVPPYIDVQYTGNPSPLLNSSLSKSIMNLGVAAHKTQFSWLRNRHRGGVRLNMCSECKVFLDCIEQENKKSAWKVHLEMDL